MAKIAQETYEVVIKALNNGDLIVDVQKGIILNRKPTKPNNCGYKQITVNGRCITHHLIMAIARWGEGCVGMTVNHRENGKQDNSWDNLELVSHRTNTKLRGRNWSSKKRSIKAIHEKTGQEFIFQSQMEASRVLNLNQPTISFVLNGLMPKYKGYFFERVV